LEGRIEVWLQILNENDIVAGIDIKEKIEIPSGTIESEQVQHTDTDGRIASGAEDGYTARERCNSTSLSSVPAYYRGRETKYGPS
jgi:hypothetical protein